jgi:hypothetical protein
MENCEIAKGGPFLDFGDRSQNSPCGLSVHRTYKNFKFSTRFAAMENLASLEIQGKKTV